MSDNTVQMETQSPAHSPEPLHLRPLPERPFTMPISPQSALVALSLADSDEEALKNLSQSLITTIQKHTKEVRLTNDTKDAHIRELEQTLGGFLPVFKAPDSYVENDDSRAPNLNIPIQDGYYQPAHWVKQLDDGRVAALPKEYTIANVPFICNIYARLHSADDSNEDPILPMQPWQKYNASANWNTPSLTRRATLTFSRLKYRVPSKPKMCPKDAWRQHASTAPSPTSTPCPTWGGGTSGSLGKTLRRGSSIVNEGIDV
jgi:hypothetical protein